MIISTRTLSLWSALFCVGFLAFGCRHAEQPKPVSNVTQPANTGKRPEVVFETTLGTIVFELYPEQAPVTSANFLRYAQESYFVETIFHRIIPGFVVQGGGLTADMREKEGQHAPIINESANKVRNARGSISMARTSDPNSATSQFFINLSQNAPLDYDESTKRPGYAVFGRVISGMDVVDKMAKVRTGNKGYHQDVPLEPIKVLKVSCR